MSTDKYEIAKESMRKRFSIYVLGEFYEVVDNITKYTVFVTEDTEVLQYEWDLEVKLRYDFIMGYTKQLEPKILYY